MYETESDVKVIVTLLFIAITIFIIVIINHLNVSLAFVEELR